jgi:carboxymethylenebutenolidase
MPLSKPIHSEEPPMLRNELDSLTPTRDFSRRDFVRTTVGSGFAAAVLPVTAQTITTDTTGLTAGAATIPVGDFKMPAYRAQPAGKTGLPVILVVSEIFGVHEHIADVARRFAKLGYLAIAPELFVRQGDAKAYTDIPKLVTEVVSKASDAQVMGDLDAAVAWAKANGGDTSKLGVTGFCWGGRITWMYAAHNPAVKAGVAWYGPVARPNHPGDKTAIEVAPQIKAAMLGLYGGADAGIPNDTVEKMRDALKAAGNTKSEVVIFPDTPHAFHADYRPSYRKEQAEAGWKRCTAWLKANGVM